MMKFQPVQARQDEFNLRIAQDNKFTEAAVTYKAYSGFLQKNVRFVGRGEARRHPEDAWAPGVGISVASARALEDLAKQLRGYVESAAGFKFD